MSQGDAGARKRLGWAWWLLLALVGAAVAGVLLAALRAAHTLAPLSYPVN